MNVALISTRVRHAIATIRATETEHYPGRWNELQTLTVVSFRWKNFPLKFPLPGTGYLHRRLEKDRSTIDLRSSLLLEFF